MTVPAAPAAAGGDTGADPPTPTARLKQATAALHRRAERAGVMPALLQGRLPITGYLALLVQLEAIYAALEAGLDRPGAPPVDPALRRLGALRHDLDTLHARAAVGGCGAPARASRGGGDREARIVPPGVLAPTARYVDHLHALAAGQPWRLAAHAYVRYLGDLAGGQALRRVVGRAYGLGGGASLEDGRYDHPVARDGGPPGDGLRFYDFGPPARAAALAQGLRAMLDARPAAQVEALVDEACQGFEAHVEIFEALAGGEPSRRASTPIQETP